MAAATFEYQGAGFYGLRSSPEEAVTTLWLDAAADPAAAAEPVSFGAATETAGGIYLFLNQPATDLPRLRSQLLQLRRRFPSLRFLWLQNPDAPLTRWQYEVLAAADNQLSRLASFDLGGYSLVLPRRSALALTETGWSLSSPNAYLSTGYGTRRLGGIAADLQLDLAGRWRFQLILERPTPGDPYDDLAALDIGFRLFFPDPLFSTAVLGETVYQSQRYPLFEETVLGQRFYDQDIALEGCWAPLDRDRSFFHFPKESLPLPSGYRTNLGYTVYLTPQPDCRLVFAAKPASSIGGEDLYLVPQGEFELTVPRRSDHRQVPDFNNNLMCGLSGVDYIKISDPAAPEHFFLELLPLATADDIPGQVPEARRPLVLVARIDQHYHLRIFHRSGDVSQVHDDQSTVEPDSILPGLGARLDALFADAPVGTPLAIDAAVSQELVEQVIASLTYELELVSLDSEAQLPGAGERSNLVLVAKIGQEYHARRWDHSGEMSVPQTPFNPDALEPGLRGRLDSRLAGAASATPVALDRHTRLRLFDGLKQGALLKSAPSFLGFKPLQSAFAPDYTPTREPVRRLRDLVASRTAASLEPFATLETLLGDNRGEAIDAIFETLKQEFLPQGYQLNDDGQRQLSRFVVSEIATLEEFEQWFQEILRLSRSQPGDGASQAAPALTGEATTAWAYLRRSLTDAVYYAQPDSSILYRPSETPDLFSFLEVSATDLTLGAAPGTFPLLPYGSITSAPEDSRQLELQVVNPLRRAQIQWHYEQPPTEVGVQTFGAAAVSTASDPVNTKQGTTPQGLLATFTEDERRMTELILARSLISDTQDQFLKFLNIERGDPLWSALRANQLLLIVDDAESLKPYFDEDDRLSGGDPASHTQITIKGWSFFFDTVEDATGKARWRPDSVLIFKYHDKPLLELIEQPSAWSQAETFVGDEAKVKEVRQRLRACFEDAIAKDTDDTDPKTRKRYAPLANIARNPSWTGIVGLNVPVPAGDGLPPDLKALAGGIKDENFFARYVGIDNTPVRPENQGLVVDPSSLFGLIDYADDQPPEPHASGYNFQVLSLRVLFENSQLTDFDSEIAVTLDRLFEERTQLQEDSELLQYELQLITADLVTDIPNRGQQTVIVADLGRHYHVRVFDEEGKRLIDRGRGQFFPDRQLTAALDNAFGALPASPDRQLLRDLTAGLGHNRSGRNLVKLQGSAESHNNKTTYVFSFSGSNRFLMPNSGVFSYVDIVKAQFSSDPAAPGSATITGRFSFWAQLGFRHLEKFDAFSFGPTAELPTEEDIELKRFLRASNLVVTLSFPQNNPQDRSFAFVPENIRFEDLPKENSLDKKLDLTRQSYRPDSLYAKFPVTLTGFIQGTGKPKGFLPVKTVFGQASLDSGWYGMAFDLDLGSLGALSSVTKLVSKLVILWLPNRNVESDTRPEPSLYVGMQLPGLGGDVMGFSLQSVLKLSFKTAELLYSQSDRTYLLKLKAIVLKLLVLSLPPNGQTELLIFGNSEGRNQPIGWYAAYAKEPAQPP